MTHSDSLLDHSGSGAVGSPGARTRSHFGKAGRKWAARGLRAIIALLLFTLLFVWVGGVNRLSISRPFEYRGDALEMLALQTHAYTANDFDTRMRAPFELAHPQRSKYIFNALFQSNSNLTWLAKWLGGGNTAKTLNLAYLLSFLLVFLSGYWVSGRMGLRNPFRFGAASLFALMPYHFQRAENHFLESTYYFIPLLAWVLVLLWSARPVAYTWNSDHWQFTWRDRRMWLALFLLAFLTSFNPYHQFFFACLAASTAPFAAAYRKNWRPLLVGWGLALFACVVLVVKHGLEHYLSAPALALGVNGHVISAYGSAEQYPLKLTQLLLPVEGHRWHAWAAFRHLYDISNPLINENSTTTLGTVGAIGFLLCVAWALVPTPKLRTSRVGKMGLVVLMALLFASMGGFGSLISTISAVVLGSQSMLTQARAWDRMVLFIAFFAYFSFFWLLQKGLRTASPRLFAGWKRVAAVWLVGLAVFAFAIWDQVPSPVFQQDAGHYRSDVAFFGNLERQLPQGARIFELPYVINHWSGWVLPGVYYTQQLRPYLASRTLHFTYGGDRGSIQSEWLHAASELPTEQAAKYLCSYGFSGVLVQRNMLRQPAVLEGEWKATLGEPPVQSSDADYSFFYLQGFCHAHAIKPLNLDAVKARLVAQMQLGRHFVPAGGLDHRIGNAFLQPDGNVALEGQAGETGWLAYGPYGWLAPGRYQATFKLSSIANSGQKGALTFSVAAKGADGLKVLESVTTKPLSTPKTVEQTVQFVVSRDYSDLEYRIFKSAGVGLVFDGVEIERVGR